MSYFSITTRISVHVLLGLSESRAIFFSYFSKPLWCGGRMNHLCSSNFHLSYALVTHHIVLLYGTALLKVTTKNESNISCSSVNPTIRKVMHLKTQFNMKIEVKSSLLMSSFVKKVKREKKI